MGGFVFQLQAGVAFRRAPHKTPSPRPIQFTKMASQDVNALLKDVTIDGVILVDKELGRGAYGRVFTVEYCGLALEKYSHFLRQEMYTKLAGHIMKH